MRYWLLVSKKKSVLVYYSGYNANVAQRVTYGMKYENALFSSCERYHKLCVKELIFTIIFICCWAAEKPTRIHIWLIITVIEINNINSRGNDLVFNLLVTLSIDQLEMIYNFCYLFYFLNNFWYTVNKKIL